MAIHEFGHLLAAVHEQGRWENANALLCNSFQGGSWQAEHAHALANGTEANLVAWGGFDTKSVMNYCNSSGAYQLTLADVVGMQQYYGERAVRRVAWASNATRTTTLPGNSALRSGQGVYSVSGEFLLIMQTDGNLVLYRQGKPLWATGTQVAGSFAEFQSDGNLVVYAPDSRALWSSNTWGNPNATLALQNDGNVVIYRQSDGRAIWATHTWEVGELDGAAIFGSDQLGSGTNATVTTTRSGAFKAVLRNGTFSVRDRNDAVVWQAPTADAYVVLITRDGNLILRNRAQELVWQSGTTGRPGSYLALREDGNLVVYEPAKFEVWSARRTPSFTPTYSTGTVLVSNGSWSAGTSTRVGAWTLSMQTDGNLVLYENSTARWASNTYLSGANRMAMQSDGNLVLYDSAGVAKWASGTDGYRNTYLSLSSDGNVSIYRTITQGVAH